LLTLVREAKPISVGVKMAVMVRGLLVSGRYEQVAVKRLVRVVGRALQFLMSLRLARKRTVPATDVVTVIGLVIPKVKLAEVKAMVAVALPVVMVVTEEVSAR